MKAVSITYVLALAITVSVITLEEVFFRVAGSEFNEAECIEEKATFVSPASVVSQASHNYTPRNILLPKLSEHYKFMGTLVTIMAKTRSLVFATVMSFLNFITLQCCCCCFLVRSTFWGHCKALFIKRALSARRDRKTIVFQLLITAIFLLFGLLLLKLKPRPAQQFVTLTTSYFNPLLSGGSGGGPIPFAILANLKRGFTVCKRGLDSKGSAKCISIHQVRKGIN